MLLPTTQFALRMTDGRTVLLVWDFAAMFAEEESRRLGENVTILKTLFFMTRSDAKPPTLDEIREATKQVGAKGMPDILRAIGATKTLALTGGLPVPERKGETSGEWDWRKAMSQAATSLDLSPAAFWKLTAFEFALRVEGAAERRRFQAQMTANLMNISGRSLKNPIDADDLLGLNRSQQDSGMPFASEMSAEERDAAIARICERLQKQQGAQVN